jgi:hypothetical protein
MFNSNTLKPINTFKLCETKVPHDYGQDVTILRASNDSYRFCHNSSESGFDSCLIVAANRTIMSVYTRPAKRRRGIAKQLLAIAKYTLTDVRHCDNLTPLGEAWRDSVESLKE